jgi:hypothetical protein
LTDKHEAVLRKKPVTGDNLGLLDDLTKGGNLGSLADLVTQHN